MPAWAVCARGARAMAVLGFLLLPGCIVQEMHDDLAATRVGVERLAELTPTLRETNAALDRSNQQLERLHGELAATHKALDVVLARVEVTNEHLRESVAELRHLDPMMASLRNLDESLAALRKTIENIDKAIPMLDISKGTPPADRAIKRQEEERAKQEAAAEKAPR